MQLKTVTSLIIILCISIAITGCTSTQNVTQAPGQTPAPAGTPSSGGSLDPSPTDAVPKTHMINVNVEKDFTGKVQVTFQGGNGLGRVKKIDVTLNRADGQVKTATVGINQGDSVSLEGTKQTDRVIVYATMDDGKSYKIIDTRLLYIPRGGNL